MSTVPLPEPSLFAHELLANGGGVWLGCVKRDICEQAHVPGETGDEVREYVTLAEAIAHAAQVEAAARADERERCAKVCDEQKTPLLGLEMNASSCAAAIRALGQKQEHGS